VLPDFPLEWTGSAHRQCWGDIGLGLAKRLSLRLLAFFAGNFPQYIPKPPDLLHRIVMHRAYPHHAVRILKAQPLRHFQGIVVPIPYIDVFLSQNYSQSLETLSSIRDGYLYNTNNHIRI
jgi:hypothetical protein